MENYLHQVERIAEALEGIERALVRLACCANDQTAAPDSCLNVIATVNIMPPLDDDGEGSP